MSKKNFKTPLISLALLWHICDVGLASEIIFTAPYQTIKLKTYTETVDRMNVEYYGDTLALYYPERDLTKGFKNFRIMRITSPDSFINFTFTFYANPNTPQTINDKIFYSDYFICRDGGFRGIANSRFLFGLGTKVNWIKNIVFFTTKSNADILFGQNGDGILDFTLAILRIDYFETSEGELDFKIIKATETTIIPSDESTATLAPLLTQSLYLSTFDTFSQRMRQLHNTPQIQGVWANITNGGQRSKLGIKSNYTSFQAGYDYDLGNQDFSNFIGGGIAYTFAIPTFSTNHISIQDQDREFSNLFSHSVAFAFYNSYLQGGGGWYNDTIFGFQYIQSLFDITNLNRNRKTSNKLGSFALNLYNEFGYRFVLFEDWYIQPQAGFGVGWITPSSFKQSFEGSDEFLQTYINHTLFLRSKFGSSFGYNLNRFIPNQNLNLSFYLGMFYECDYTLEGGKNINTTNLSSTYPSQSLLDQHFLFNLGTSINAYKNINLYFDFEKSFLGKTTKDYQVSLGVRYGFGDARKSKMEKKDNELKRGFTLFELLASKALFAILRLYHQHTLK